MNFEPQKSKRINCHFDIRNSAFDILLFINFLLISVYYLLEEDV
jgi:hypothetical protein